jgi:hypothetical protein
MSGIINQVGARSGIISGGGAASAGTVTLSGTTGLDYEEGTWTPAIVGGTMTFALQSATYTKIGRSVTIQSHWTGANNGDSTGLIVSGMPFPAGGGEQYAVGTINYATGNVDVGHATPRIGPSATQIYFSSNPQSALLQTDIDFNHFIFNVTYFSA